MNDKVSLGPRHSRLSKSEIAKQFKDHLDTRGGIFTKRTRRRLLGLPVGRATEMEGRLPTNDFWYDVRQDVKLGLRDLELFLQAADRKEMNQVLNGESFAPVLDALFWGPTLSEPPDAVRAEMARLSIERGFDYLRQKAKRGMTMSHQRTIEEAVDLSSFLADTVKPELDRKYGRQVPWTG